MIKILFFSILITLFFLPENFWQRYGLLLKSLFQRLKKNELERAKHFSRYLEQVIILSRLGKEIERAEGIYFPPYSNILEKLLKMKALQGSNIASQLQILKHDIHEEIIFLNQKRKISQAAHAQFVSMMLIIFSFQFFSSSLLDIDFDFLTAFYCIGLELLGFIFFHCISRQKLKKLFKELHQLQSFFCEAESMIYGQLPANRVVQQLAEFSPVLSGAKEREIYEQLFYLLKNWQQSGVPIREDFKMLKDDLLHYRQEIMTRAKKFLDLMVFVILVLFFLSSYFLSLSPLFQVIFVA